MGSAKLHLVRKPQPSGAGGRELRRALKGEASRSLEQVAAICYRIRKLKIEFLLVQTRKGRWTFPKGGIVPGWSRVQSAALEAFEEAGVHGRIEEASFTTYLLRKRRLSKSAGTVLTYAHLCEVARVVPPEERNRNPTWFSPKRAQLCLIEDRTWEDAAELTRLVERAVIRIHRLIHQSNRRRDSFETVAIEASNRSSRRTMAKVIDFDRAAGNVLR
jgi:8-oxo-dGTP pyrophosphatase MutT (NUDIX family)